MVLFVNYDFKKSVKEPKLNHKGPRKSGLEQQPGSQPTSQNMVPSYIYSTNTECPKMSAQVKILKFQQKK